MRNHYDRPYIVIHELVAERRGRTFEHKLADAETKGFELVGHPCFEIVQSHKFGEYYIVGTVLMRRRTSEV
jgi:hypothetical protein